MSIAYKKNSEAYKANAWLKKASKVIDQAGGRIPVDRLERMSLVEFANICECNHIDPVYFEESTSGEFYRRCGTDVRWLKFTGESASGFKVGDIVQRVGENKTLIVARIESISSKYVSPYDIDFKVKILTIGGEKSKFLWTDYWKFGDFSEYDPEDSINSDLNEIESKIIPFGKE